MHKTTCTDRRPGAYRFAAGVGLPTLALVVAAIPGAAAAQRQAATLERRALAMGTSLTVTVEADDREVALVASEAALGAVAEVEERLSTWSRESELSRLNRARPGAEVAISPELEAELRAAVGWWRETDGAFDPGIASLVAAWDLRGDGRTPARAELATALVSAGLGHLALGAGAARVDVAGFGIDEGGFGKGVGLREAVAAATAAGANCVVMNLGGQIEIAGDCGERWVDIADPRTREAVVARFSLGAGSVATSGNSERGLVVDGVEVGHLLDPSTGWPAPDWGAVTVVAEDAVAADCLATALYVMGPQRGAEWLRTHPEIQAVWAESGGEGTRLTATAGLRGRLVVPEGSVRYLDRESVNTTK